MVGCMLAAMLVIRRPQIDVLAAPQREALVESALRSLAELFPGDPRLADEPATTALVHQALERAAGYGLARERELLLFVYLVFDQGLGFESRPDQAWIEQILRHRGLHEREKLDAIYTRLEHADRGGRP
jgi:hypothetical protein